MLDDAAKMTDCLQKAGTLTGTGAAESFLLNTTSLGITSNASLWHILNVSNPTTGVIYIPVLDRQEYQGYRNQIVTNSLSTSFYIYNIFGYGTASNRKIYLLPYAPSGTNNITVEYSETHPAITYTTGTETPSGLLNDYDALVIEGVAALYFQYVNDEENEREAFARYMDWVQRLGSEVGVTKPIQPQTSALFRFIGKTMKDLSNANRG